MKFKIYREFGALNSKPIFDALEAGIKRLGHTVSESDQDVAVVWSALWAGKMLGNQKIYEKRKQAGLPTIFIEIGNLKRNQTWRISINNINGQGIFANKQELDSTRPAKLGIFLDDPNKKRIPKILIACQHSRSLQWEGMPATATWVDKIVKDIKTYTNMPIVVRPHPRDPIRTVIADVEIERPVIIPGTYDDFNINYNYHCVINHNSGPPIQAAIKGTPVIVDRSSLAYPISSKIENIQNLELPDRQQWLIELAHTEWVIEEIEAGIPFLRLIPELKKLM